MSPANAEGDFVAAIIRRYPTAAPVGRVTPGVWIRFPAVEDARDRAGAALLFPDLERGTIGDHRSGVFETWTAPAAAAAGRKASASPVSLAVKARQKQRELARAHARSANRELWSQCSQIQSADPVALYLSGRRLNYRLSPDVVRVHQALPYWHDRVRLGEYPAMVARVAGHDGTVALHRTYLTTMGTKAAVPTVKKLTAASGPLAGCAVPLFAPVDGVIGVAEGIETALATTALFGTPTVAAYCAGNLAVWEWPSAIKKVVIFADNDVVGRGAADRLRQRVERAGLEAAVMTPDLAASDWADAWTAAEGSK